MYSALLMFELLKNWVDACPDLSITFRRAKTSPPIGIVIALSARQSYWDDLLCGALKEAEVDPEVAFPSREPASGGPVEEVGLHIFHIKRFSDDQTLAAGTEMVGSHLHMAVDEIIRRGSLRKQWKLFGVLITSLLAPEVVTYELALALAFG